jgi:D-alanine--poly(phosphoribitol) ligase subunit 1
VHYCSASRKLRYRTGDLVRVRADGLTVYFFGRKDNQIKYLGYRIELEEMQVALNSLSSVHESAVVFVAGGEVFGTIDAFLGSAEKVSVADVLDRLRTCLPPYVIPDRFKVFRDLSKNDNRRVDSMRLAENLRERLKQESA